MMRHLFSHIFLLINQSKENWEYSESERYSFFETFCNSTIKKYSPVNQKAVPLSYTNVLILCAGCYLTPLQRHCKTHILPTPLHHSLLSIVIFNSYLCWYCLLQRIDQLEILKTMKNIDIN